jgi:hypothetical protein
MKTILNDLLRGCELTACNNHTYWMNKYRSNWYQIDEEIGLCLIQSNAIVEDSANFETGETHYILDCDYIFNDKLNNINFLLNKINYNLKYGEKFINELKILKLREERRLKLKKIKQIC